MKSAALLLALLLGLAGCGDGRDVAEAPPPQEPTPEDIGYFCGMSLPDHPGPKGQVFLAGEAEPLWFSAIRDVLAYTHLPEESRPVAAIYVNDMARARDWEQPEAGMWVRAEEAFYVIGSDRRGGMGEAAIVPFSDRVAADAFRERHGGKVYSFREVPSAAVLGGGEAVAPDSGESAQPQLSARPAAAKDGKGGQDHGTR